MKKRIKHLSDLQKHVESLVKKHGGTAPCAAWVITREDFVTVGTNERDTLVSKDEAQQMIDDMHLFEYNFIDDHLKRIIQNEKTNRNL
tara:strand:- start:1434 stop:1697 length:264 start_codon:yes stop_codon:yes gene_type:complete